jgi:type IV secretory pathway VirB2 component (pilin)
MIRRVVIAGLILSPSAVAAANSIAGPVTFTIALLGVGVAGPALMLGGGIEGLARRLLKLALAIALILLAANLLSILITAGAGIL